MRNASADRPDQSLQRKELLLHMSNQDEMNQYGKVLRGASFMLIDSIRMKRVFSLNCGDSSNTRMYASEALQE